MKKVYSIEGIDCANCAAKIEDKINRMKNIEEANLNFMMGKLSIEFKLSTDEEVEEEFKKMADAYKMEVDKIKELLGDRELEQMKKDMAVQKAVTLVADEAKEA